MLMADVPPCLDPRFSTISRLASIKAKKKMNHALDHPQSTNSSVAVHKPMGNVTVASSTIYYTSVVQTQRRNYSISDTAEDFSGHVTLTQTTQV